MLGEDQDSLTPVTAGVADRVLTQRLRDLEPRGLLERTVVPTTPIR